MNLRAKDDKPSTPSSKSRYRYILQRDYFDMTEAEKARLEAVLKELDIKFTCYSWTEVEKVYETRWDCPSEPFRERLKEYRERVKLIGEDCDLGW